MFNLLGIIGLFMAGKEIIEEKTIKPYPEINDWHPQDLVPLGANNLSCLTDVIVWFLQLHSQTYIGICA